MKEKIQKCMEDNNEDGGTQFRLRSQGKPLAEVTFKQRTDNSQESASHMKRKNKKILGRRKGRCDYAEVGNNSVCSRY